MQYVGGKSKIAKQIVAQMPVAGRRVWEPFCGGIWVSIEIAKAGAAALTCSDACKPLIEMYRAVKAGWIPPTVLSEAEYAAAKKLPDTDPIKAFAGFGCSFGGKWFGGYARSPGHNFADAASRGLRKHLGILEQATFEHYDFLDSCDKSDDDLKSCGDLLIYCDPPYASTETYKATKPFDHDKFWQACRRWRDCGADVYVSEYSAPKDCVCVWSKTHALSLAGGCQPGKRTENLYHMGAK